MRALILIALVALTACAPIQRPGTTLPLEASVSHTAPTGILPLDTLIGAIAARDEVAFARRIKLTTFACTTEDGLGGPPKCPAGVADGTPVQVIPVLESHAAYPSTLPLVMDSLVAVYRMPADASVPDADWPRGEYALLYRTAQSQSAITLYVDAEGNVVRATSHFLMGTDPMDYVPAEVETLYQP